MPMVDTGSPGPSAFARAGLSRRRRGLGERTDSGLGRPPELGFQGCARVIMSWVWVSRFGVLQVSAGSAQIGSACEKLYSSIAVSKTRKGALRIAAASLTKSMSNRRNRRNLNLNLPIIMLDELVTPTAVFVGITRSKRSRNCLIMK
jgi:hypothetical protein